MKSMISMAKRRSSAARYKVQSQKTFLLRLNLGTFTKRTFADVDINQCINRLIYGSYINKITKSGEGKIHSVFFYILEDDLTQLQWISNSKQFRDTRIDLATVTSISDIPTHAKKKLLAKYGTDRLLSIRYGLNDSEELLLYFNSEQEKKVWWSGIQYFIEKAQIEHSIARETSNALAKEIFLRADADGTRTLSRAEIRNIFKDLQIHVNKQKINEVFSKYDQNHDGQFDFEEFKVLVKELLRKKELIPIFRKYCPEFVEEDFSLPVMTLLELQDFFHEEQKQDATLEDLRTFNPIFKDLHPSKPCISFDIFTDIIFSLYNTIFSYENAVEYQDMRRPLTDYYINSSHNTYLTANQITGESSVHAYINAILLGCRCVEIDLWNGPGNEPIIYHGHTMTSKIMFEDVIVALKQYAFTKSQYPLILSFEMHCDLKGQKRVAQIIKKHIGDMLFVIPADHSSYEYYPSPDLLMNKFIIKGKGKIASRDDMYKLMDLASPALKADGIKSSKFDFESPERNEQTKHFSVFESSVDSQLDFYEGSTDTIADFRMSPMKRFLMRKNSDNGIQDDDDDDAPSLTSKNLNFLSILSMDKQPLFIKQPAISPFSHREYNTNTGVIGLNNKSQTLNVIPIQGKPALDESVDEAEGVRVIDKMNTLAVNNYFDKPPQLKYHKRHASYQPMNNVIVKDAERALNGSVVDIKLRSVHASPQKKEGKILKVLPELNELYGLIGSKINLKLERSIWEIASVDEGKIIKLNRNHQKEIVNFHRKYLTRIYPTASRIDSSNFDPIPAWASGSQMVALNYQTHDEAMLLNYAKFCSNGGVGYVLKPRYLCHNTVKSETVFPLENKKPMKKLIIRIISGQQIRPDNYKSNEIIDPYVVVKLRGLDIDENNHPLFRTQTIKDNGFHPVWAVKETSNVFEFNIAAPDFCIITFTVYDEDVVGRDKIGWYAIEFKNIQQGYRVIPVLGANFKPINHSYVFCHVTIKDL